MSTGRTLAVAAVASAGLLFAVGFALGSQGQDGQPGPTPTAPADARVSPIGTLHRAEPIPSLRATKSAANGSSPTPNSTDTSAQVPNPGPTRSPVDVTPPPPPPPRQDVVSGDSG